MTTNRNYYYKRVLVLYVGGTIGMQQNEKGELVPVANSFISRIKSIPDLHDSNEETKYFRSLKSNELILRSVLDSIIVYEVIEYDPLLDSSNMNVSHWCRIASDIEKWYSKYDGFVILHGTDTMAYTASAISFQLNGLQKPVIFTGSQISIFEARSDAKDNFLASLIIAGCYDLNEVCILFANKLLRANRTCKMHSSYLNAFNSPNYPALGEIGINIEIKTYNKIGSLKETNFKAHTNLNGNVAVVYLFPTITATMLEGFLTDPVQGIILQTYGAGNISSDQQDVLEKLSEAVNRKIIIVNISQCAQGTVNAAYETGKVLEKIGIISGGDMTCEAAFTKLIYVLSIPDISHEDRLHLMQVNLRGEMTN